MNKIEEAENYLLQIPKFIKKNSFEDGVEFYHFLESPGKDLKKIHIAGTNGKGSVCAYLNQILIENGFQTGMFTSPHLESIRERFRFNNEIMSPKDFLIYFNKILDKVEEYRKDKSVEYHPSFFEFLFFMCMLYFKDKKTDFLILETGLGGRLDATNMIQNPFLCVITSIGMDHMEYLGSTIKEIAAEKAGIIKENSSVVFLDKKSESTEIIEKTIKEMKAKGSKVSPEEYVIETIRKNSIDFSLESRYYGYVRLNISSCALYQVENAAIAYRATEKLVELGIELDSNKVITAIGHTVWKGRMEEILPNIFLDGAHNEDGIDAFLETVKEQKKKKRCYLLFSAVSDKKYGNMIKKIQQSGLFDEIIISGMNNTRSIDPKNLEEQFLGKEKLFLFEHSNEAFQFAKDRMKFDELLYVAGSLYLVGEIEELVHKDKKYTNVDSMKEERK